MRMTVASALFTVLALGGFAASEAGGLPGLPGLPRLPGLPPVASFPDFPQHRVVPGPPPVRAGIPPRARHAPHSRVIVSPRSVFVVAPYAVASTCYVPGHWTYQWVPQTYTYNTWVDGYWSPYGTWIDGHYEPQVYSTGYYQQIWVDGGYGC